MAKEGKKELLKLAHTVTGIGWANGKQACVYAGIGPDTLKKWLDDGLVHSRVGGLLRIKYTDIDDYIKRYRVTGQPLEETSRTARSILDRVM